MGKHRSMKNFQQLRAFSSLAVGALAANDLSSGPLGPALQEDYFLTSIDGTWSMIGVALEGPIVVGVAHGDYTAPEIEECLEVLLVRPGDKIAKERANRLVRTIGVFDQNTTPEQLNDGKSLKTKLNWSLGGDADGLQGIQMWAHSLFGGTLSGGALLKFQGKFNGRWQV